MKMKYNDKIFIIPIILLSINFIYRLINFAHIIKEFPVDITNDLTSYTALVYFFDLYGYMGTVPHWFNGFTLFNTYPPGWIVFTHSIYFLTEHLMIAIYLSTLILYALGFLAICLIAKKEKLSKIKTIFFFLIAFANPMLIGAVLKQGRLPSLMGLVLLIYIAYFALYYRDNKLDYKILFLAPIMGILILTHQPETILSGFILLGLLFVKNNIERIIIILTLLLGIILSSFWLIEFITYALKTDFLSIGYSTWLLDFSGYMWSNIAIFLICIALFTTSYLYLKQNKKDTLFFAPILILNFLLLFRLVTLIPIIKHIYPDPYQDFFIFFLGLFLVKIDFNQIQPLLKKIFAVLLTLFVIAGVSYNVYYTPTFEDYTETEINFFNVMGQIEEKYFFIITERFETSYSKPYYAYGAIYLDIDTISGWGDMFKEREYTDYVNGLHEIYASEKDCSVFEGFSSIGTKEIVTSGSDCDYMVNTCNLKEKYRSGNICLLEIT